MHHSWIRPRLEIRVCSISCRFWWRPIVFSLKFQTSTCGWAVAISAHAKWMLWFLVLEWLSPPRGTWPVGLVTVLGCVGRGSPMTLAAVGEVKAHQPKGRIWGELKVNCREIIHPNHQSARPQVEQTHRNMKLCGETKCLLENLKQQVEGRPHETPEVERIG